MVNEDEQFFVDSGSNLRVIIAQSALMQLLASAEQVVVTDDNSGDFHKFRDLYHEYLGLQLALLPRNWTLLNTGKRAFTGITEKDLRRTLGSKYDKFKLKVEIVEQVFLLVAESIKLKRIRARNQWFQRNKKFSLSVVQRYHDVVAEMQAMRSSSDDVQRNTELFKQTREVLDVLLENTSSTGGFHGWDFLRASVQWNMTNGVKHMCLLSVSSALKDMKEMVTGRRLYSWPDFNTQTYAVAWEMRQGNDRWDGSVESIKPSPKAVIQLPEDISQLVEALEVRAEGNNQQIRVDKDDFGLNGKYRGVCKLYVTCLTENSPSEPMTFVGSGWLYDAKTVVTAGHNVWNTDNSAENYGKICAIDVDVYLGHCEIASSDNESEELRRARWVLTHKLWYDHLESKCDIAVIRLESPFQHPKQYLFAQPVPKLKPEPILVVGYPFDVPKYEPDAAKLKDAAGRIMYESSWNTDLRQPESELQYRADTTGGNSGCPVFRYQSDKVTLEVIGVHTGGIDIKESVHYGLNSATTLGYHGNRLLTFVDALNQIEHNSISDQGEGAQTEAGPTPEQDEDQPGEQFHETVLEGRRFWNLPLPYVEGDVVAS